jgi:Tol biopolymer transport system component
MKTSTVCRPILLLPILAIGLLSPVLAQNPEALYQQGLIKEEGEGSLLEAIDIYKQVSENEAAGRSLQAEALLHMGLCYEKLGRQEAQTSYRKIVNNFPEQTETVRIASEKLSYLSRAAKGIPETDHELKILKVWEGPEDLMGETSPDGKYLSYVDWDTGDLAFYELATGKKKRLTSKGTWDESYAYAEYSRWSPDGSKLVYAWYNEDDRYDLRIIGLDGSHAEVLNASEEVSYWAPFDWSPDGTKILVVISPAIYGGDPSKIALVSVEDGSIQALRKLDNWPNQMTFSPDGRYIAFDSYQGDGTSNRDICLMDLEGNVKGQLVHHPAHDILLGWTPDGRHMLFSSDRDGTLGLYLQEVSGGNPVGSPRLVQSDMGKFETLGFTPDGSFYYGISKDWYNLYVTELDPASGALVNPPEKMTTRFEGNNREPDYSPDGRFLAYTTWKDQSSARIGTGSWGGDLLVIRDLETGDQKEIFPGHQIGFPRWSPDGSSVLVVIRNPDNFRLCRIEAESGQMHMIHSPEGMRDGFGRHEWSPDGNYIYYGKRVENSTRSQIIRHHLPSGSEKVIFETSDHFLWQSALSPDGKWLVVYAVAGGHGLYLLSTEGGELQELFNKKEAMLGVLLTLTWSLDGDYIYFSMRDASVEDPKWELCRIPASGGEIEHLELELTSNISGLSMHPDGRHIAYSASSNLLTPSVWVIENFLPAD